MLYELAKWGLTLVPARLSAVGRRTLSKENQDFATHPVTCCYKATCKLLFPFGPATFDVAWKATVPFVIILPTFRT